MNEIVQWTLVALVQLAALGFLARRFIWPAKKPGDAKLISSASLVRKKPR